MISYLEHSEIDLKKWDQCISTAHNATFYALSDVLNITSPNWNALILDDYTAVFPLPWRKKFGTKYIYPPFFSTQLGLFSKSEMDVLPYFKAIPSKFKYIEYKLNTSSITPDSLPIMQHNRTFHLNLIPSYEELSTKFSKNHKQNIKKSHQNSLRIEQTFDPKPIIELFQLNKGNLSSFNEKDYEVLETLMKHLINKGKAEIWSVFNSENTLCAGGFFITDFQKHVFLFSGSNSEAKEKRALFFLFDNYISTYASTPNTLDFGGSNDDNLARFYEGFGSTANFFDTICINRMGKMEKLMQKVIRKVKK